MVYINRKLNKFGTFVEPTFGPAKVNLSLNKVPTAEQEVCDLLIDWPPSNLSGGETPTHAHICKLPGCLDHKIKLNKSKINCARLVAVGCCGSCLGRIIKKPTIGAWRDYQHGQAPFLSGLWPQF